MCALLWRVISWIISSAHFLKNIFMVSYLYLESQVHAYTRSFGQFHLKLYPGKLSHTEIFLYHLNHYTFILWFISNINKTVALYRNLCIPQMLFFKKFQCQSSSSSPITSLSTIGSWPIVTSTQVLIMLSWKWLLLMG